MEFINLVATVEKKLLEILGLNGGKDRYNRKYSELWWGNLCANVCKILNKNGTGITMAILLTELQIIIEHSASSKGTRTWFWTLASSESVDPSRKHQSSVEIDCYTDDKYWDFLEDSKSAWIFQQNRKVRMTQIQTSTPIPSLSHLNDIKIKRIIPGAKTVIILDVPTDVLLNPSVNIERHESVLITNQNTESEINEHHFDFKIKDAVLIPASKYSDLGFIFHEFDSVWNYNFNAFTQSPLSKVPSVDAGNHFFLIKRIDTRTMYPADDAPLTLETQGALNNMGYSSIDQQPFYTTKDVKVVIGEKFNEFGEIITYELELYGPDMIYASLFNMGDYIGVCNSKSKNLSSGSIEKVYKFQLQLMDDSVIFALDKHTLKFNRSESANSDTIGLDNSEAMNRSRIAIQDLYPGMKNFSLLCHVVGISNTIVRELNYEKRTVVAVKVADESGTCDITFWDAISAQAAQLYIGQTVLIGGLATIIKDGIVYVNAGYEQGSYMYVINTLSGLLSSLPLRDTSFISEIFEKESGFISGYIRDIRPSTLHKTIDSSDSRRFDYKCSNFLINTHKFCMNPVERNQETQTKNLYKCPKCPSDEDQITTKDTSYQFNIELKVEDGSSCVWMRCNPHAANSMLCMSPRDFVDGTSSCAEYMKLFSDLVGCRFNMSISNLLVLPSNRYKFGNKMQLNGMNNEACVPFRIEAAMPTIC